MAAVLASTRCRALTDGELLLGAVAREEAAAEPTVRCQYQWVVRRTFMELVAPAIHEDSAAERGVEECASSEGGSEVTTAPRCESDQMETSEDDVLTPRSAAFSPRSPPGVFALGRAAGAVGAARPSQGDVDASHHAAMECTPEKSPSRRSRRKTSSSVWSDARLEQAEAVPEENRTTLLIKNFRRDCATETLAELLDAEGFAGRYDFAYVPINFSQYRAFGYAFVNFCTPQGACEALAHLHGSSCWTASGPEPGQETLEVQYSDPHQGLQIQIARYQNSPIMHSSIPANLKPMLFEGGVRKGFPRPTKAIKIPRARRRGDTGTD